jgi:hypothetical protein
MNVFGRQDWFASLLLWPRRLLHLAAALVDWFALLLLWSTRLVRVLLNRVGAGFFLP